MFPDTGSTQREYDSYDKYYRNPDAIGVFGQTTLDNRLEQKDTVLGVAIEEVAWAYTFLDLITTPVINDLLNPTGRRGGVRATE